MSRPRPEDSWSDRHDAVLRREHDRMTRTALCERLGCTMPTLRKHLRRLNLMPVTTFQNAWYAGASTMSSSMSAA